MKKPTKDDDSKMSAKALEADIKDDKKVLASKKKGKKR